MPEATIRKIYWHELTDEQRLDTWEKGGLKVHEFMEKYSQPDWCCYPDALMPYYGCWSLVMLPIRIKTENDCKYCEYYRLEISNARSND